MTGRHIGSQSKRPTTRNLLWDGCLNVRDLGGLPLPGGGQTRFCSVVRADSIRQLSDAGWEALVAYGVRRAIDLRGEEECADDPPRELPIEVVRAPMPPREEPVVWEFPSMKEAYLAMLERFRPQFARVVAEVGRDDSTVVVHCAGGRDRTGLVTALLLRLVGVDPGLIAADHALSDEVYAPLNEAWFAEAEDEVERERRRRIARPAGDTMARVLAELEGGYGNVAGYLRAGGATDEQLERAEARLAG
jgi:protein-tyrosine phosphatase